MNGVSYYEIQRWGLLQVYQKRPFPRLEQSAADGFPAAAADRS